MNSHFRPQNDFSPKEGGSFNPIVSARLNTRRAFAFQYGQLEVRAKVPEGDWIWPGKYGVKIMRGQRSRINNNQRVDIYF